MPALESNVRPAAPRNYLVAKKASLWFRATGLTGESDWREFGNIIDPATAIDITQLEHFSNRRGARALDRTEQTDKKIDLNFTMDEANTPNLQHAFGSSIAKTSGTVTVRDGKVVANPGNAGTIDVGVVNLASLIVRSTNNEGSVTTYVLTTDYTVVLATGIITITAGALTSAAAVPEIHVHYTKSLATEKFTMFDGTTIRGQAQLQILGSTAGKECRVVAEFPSVEIANNGDVAFGNGDDWTQFPMKMKVLVDTAGNSGTIHVVNAAESF